MTLVSFLLASAQLAETRRQRLDLNPIPIILAH